jgi:NAD(P) transhydrogenase
VTLRFGEEVSGMELMTDAFGDRVRIHLASGKQIITDTALYSVGRTGATASLNLPAAGVQTDERGRLEVNESYQTSVPHVYAVGDVIGFPSLVSTSMEQGRLAACHAFGVKATSVPALFPYGIYAIPRISMVGRTEEELTDHGVPYEVGKAQLVRVELEQQLQQSERAHHRRGRQRADPHRPGGARLWWHDRVLRQYGLQLPNARRVLTRRPRSTG